MFEPARGQRPHHVTPHATAYDTPLRGRPACLGAIMEMTPAAVGTPLRTLSTVPPMADPAAPGSGASSEMGSAW